MRFTVVRVLFIFFYTWHYGDCENSVTENYQGEEMNTYPSNEYYYPDYGTEVYENNDLIEFHKLLEEQAELANSAARRKFHGTTDVPVATTEPNILSNIGNDQTDDPLIENTFMHKTLPVSTIDTRTLEFNSVQERENAPTTTANYVDIDSSSGSTVNINIASTSTNNNSYEHEDPELSTTLSSANDRMVEVEKRLSASVSSSNGKSHENRKSLGGNTNEIHNFLSEIEQQTPLIAVACIISTIILTTLVYLAFRVMTRLNQTTNVSLISHSEYPDVFPSNQQYQVQKLVIKQQVQQEKVQKQTQMSAVADKSQSKGNSKNSQDIHELQQISNNICVQGHQNEENLGKQNDGKQSNENASTTTLEISPAPSDTDGSSPKGDKVNRDRQIRSKFIQSGDVQTERCAKTGSKDRFDCIDVIIENGNCLECIEAMQKRSSEELEKNDSCATITYHLGDGICNDENHFGSLTNYRDFTEISLH